MCLLHAGRIAPGGEVHDTACSPRSQACPAWPKHRLKGKDGLKRFGIGSLSAHSYDGPHAMAETAAPCTGQRDACLLVQLVQWLHDTQVPTLEPCLLQHCQAVLKEKLQKVSICHRRLALASEVQGIAREVLRQLGSLQRLKRHSAW